MTEPFFPVQAYELLAQLSGGNFGVVHRARRTHDRLIVALKRVSDPEKIEAEKRGVKLQMDVWHRNHDDVPEIIAHGMGKDGHYYIAMQFIDDPSLQTRSGAIEPRQAAAIALSIAEVLERLHRYRAHNGGRHARLTVHADLKPAHVCLRADGRVTLLDFGIAKPNYAVHPATVARHANKMYSSPEQLLHGVVNPSVDLWALGVMLYEMVADRHPFEDFGDTAEDIARAIQQGQQPPELPASCPAGLKAIIRKFMAPDVRHRYQKAASAIEDLKRFLAGRETGAERAGRTPETFRVGQQPAQHLDQQPPKTRPGRPVEPSGRTPPAPSTPPPESAARTVGRMWRLLLLIVVGVVIMVLVSTTLIGWRRADALLAKVAQLELSSVPAIRDEIAAASRWTPIGLALHWRVRRPLVGRLDVLANRTIDRYREDHSGLTKLIWEQSGTALNVANELGGSERKRNARLKYIEGQVYRFLGDNAATGIHEIAEGHFQRAIASFRASIELDDTTPDAHLGLARVHATWTREPDLVVEAIGRAERCGYQSGPREVLQIANAHRLRADTRLERAGGTTDIEERVRYLAEAARDYRDCMTRLSGRPQNPVYKQCSNGLARLGGD